MHSRCIDPSLLILAADGTSPAACKLVHLQETRLLSLHVKKHGASNWSEIALQLGCHENVCALKWHTLQVCNWVPCLVNGCLQTSSYDIFLNFPIICIIHYDDSNMFSTAFLGTAITYSCMKCQQQLVDGAKP